VPSSLAQAPFLDCWTLEDEGPMIPWNIRKGSSNDMVPHPGR